MQIGGTFYWRVLPKGKHPRFYNNYAWAAQPNQWCLSGITSALAMIFQASTSDIAAAGNWYVGLCRITTAPVITETLAGVANEPTSAGGYARQAATRDGTGWPTALTVNDVPLMRSKVLSFAASGADYDEAINRMFLTDQASGTSGILYSISGPLTVNRTVLDGETYQVYYEVGLR